MRRRPENKSLRRDRLHAVYREPNHDSEVFFRTCQDNLHLFNTVLSALQTHCDSLDKSTPYNREGCAQTLFASRSVDAVDDGPTSMSRTQKSHAWTTSFLLRPRSRIAKYDRSAPSYLTVVYYVPNLQPPKTTRKKTKDHQQPAVDANAFEEGSLSIWAQMNDDRGAV